MDTFYTTKLGQTHTYDTDGRRLLITKLSAKATKVVQVKTTEKDGYTALQVGLGEKKRINKPLSGHFKNAGAAVRYLREIKLENGQDKKAGEEVVVSEVFKVGDKVNVTAKSKGKGFAGGVKRWGFRGGPKTHGQSDRHRAPGSIGQGTTPGRVWKGKKMAGRMGNVISTVRGSQVVHIDEKTEEIWVTGTVPGATGSLVKITKVAEGNFKGLINTAKEKEVVETQEIVVDQPTEEIVQDSQEINNEEANKE